MVRIVCDHQVAYLDVPLTIKRAGDWSQLSTQWNSTEAFRIVALQALVDNAHFCGAQMAAACEELVRKCRIHANGAHRRGRHTEAADYESLARCYVGPLSEVM